MIRGKQMKRVSVSMLVLVSLWVGVGRGEVRQQLEPDDLLSACALISCDNRHVGSGFFVEVQGQETNTWLVTAWHVLEEVKTKYKKQSLTLMVKRKGGGRRVSILIRERGVRVNAWADIAVIPIRPEFLHKRGADIEPLVYRTGRAGGKAEKRGEREIVGNMRVRRVEVGAPIFMVITMVERERE